jgi:hypothetical protein
MPYKIGRVIDNGIDECGSGDLTTYCLRFSRNESETGYSVNGESSWMFFE